MRMQARVAVQKENIWNPAIQRPLHTLVASFRKAKVTVINDEVNLGKSKPYRVRGSIHRAVIDDYDLKCLMGRLKHALQTCEDIVTTVPIQDDGGDSPISQSHSIVHDLSVLSRLR